MGKEAVSLLLPTFRDPAGQLELHEKVATRKVRPPFDVPLLAFIESEQAHRLVHAGDLIATRVTRREPLELEHPRIAFVSYPWEWPSAMWVAAGELTLRLCLDLLEEGRILRDGTPLNILFQGTRPMLVDVLSIETAEPTRRTWPGYGQFIRTFLLPLLAFRELGWPLPATINRRDGYEPEELWPRLSLVQRMGTAALTTVTLPSLLGRRGRGGGKAATEVVAGTDDPDLARYTVRRALRSLQRTLSSLRPKTKKTQWTEYLASCTHYAQADHEAKREFVRSVLVNVRPSRVLDVGCNTGEYSLLAAEVGAYVVGIESDGEALNRMHARVSTSDYVRSITMVQANLARPTPAVGWLNRESLSLIDRCRASFDLCLMLAVVHHLLLCEQIPLVAIASLCSQMTQRDLIIEWVPAEDQMYRALMRGRDEIYGEITANLFLQAFEEWFEVLRTQILSNGRTLFHMRRRASAVSSGVPG